MALVVYQGPTEHAGPSIPDSPLNETGERFVGLSNQGATCYLNGLLQTLFMTPEFRKAIFTWNYDPEKHGAEEWCITLQLQRLFGLLQLSRQRSVDTVALTHSFGWEGSEVFQQQDVQELTRVLFDAIEQTLKGTAIENIIDDLYAGELIDYLRCIDVDYESERVDKFLDFSLAIVPFGSDKAMHSLTECIEMFLKPEILDGDNKYYAEKFDMKVDAIKGLKFGRLPQIMSVQLKRFVYDFSGPHIVQKKLNDVVKFPMILDMNKYVGRRSSSARREGASDGTTGVDEEGKTSSDAESADADTGAQLRNEFEEYLRAQMESLKASRSPVPAPANGVPSQATVSDQDLAAAISQAMAAGETGTGSGPVAMSMPAFISEPPEYEEQDLEAGLQTVDLDSHTSHSDTPATVAATAATARLPAAAVVGADEEDCKSPTAVDVVGAEGAAASGEPEPDTGVFYGSLTKEQVAEMVAARGEWVYELYAVLIHSGVINGGHYYAYIKDLASGRWWNFNDSTVTAIDEKTVQEAWGKRNVYGHSAYQAPTFYGTSLYRPAASSGGSLSSANAYMLMYRKVTPRDHHPGATGVDLLAPPPLVTDDMVPQYIRDLVEAQAKEAEERRRAQEAERNKINIRVFFNGQEHVVATTRSTTFRALMAQLWHQLGLKEHLGDALVRYRSRKGEAGEASEGVTASGAVGAIVRSIGGEDEPCFELFRLRNYNTYTQLRSEAWEVEAAGAQTLGELSFHNNRTFYLETRTGEEDWEVYHLDGLTMLLIEYDPVAGAFKEPRNLRLKRTATLGDVRKAVTKWTTYDESRIRLMKIVNCGYNDAQLDVLTDDSARLREDLSIYEGYKLYFEDAPDPEARSKAYEAFLTARNTFELRVCRPGETDFDLTMKADLRWTVTQLRQVVAETLGVGDKDIRMFKQSLRGQELRDGTASLAVNGLYNLMALAVSYGKATPQGYFNVQLTEFVARDNRVGIVELPHVEDEVEEVVGAVDPAPITAVDEGPDSPPLPPLVEVSATEPSAPPPPPDVPVPLLTSVPPPALFPTSSSAAGQVDLYSDQDYDLDAALAASLQDIDVDSTASNAGVVDADELQLCDDDLDACQEPSVDAVLVEDDAVADVGSTEASELLGGTDLAFELGAAKVARNSGLVESPSYSLKVPTKEAGVQSTSARAVPLLDVSKETLTLQGTESDLPSLTSVTTSPVPADSAVSPEPATSATVGVAAAIRALGPEEDVPPSDFGEKMVSNNISINNFRAVDGLDAAFVQNSSTFLEVKEQIVTRLIELGRLPEGTSPRCVRLRDKMGNNPGRILAGDGTFADNQIYLFDGKVLAFQVLDFEEELPEPEAGSVVVLVQRWNRREWRLEERFEVLLNGGWSVRNIARGLSLLMDIPLPHLRAMIVCRDTEFLLSDLHLNAPPRNYGRTWFDPSRETRPLRAMSHDMRLTDGDVLLVQDTSEPLRELSAADRKSIEIVRLASGSDPYSDCWASMYDPVLVPSTGSRNPFDSSPGAPTTSGTGKALKHGHGSSSNGVYIRTQRDRQRETSDRSLSSAVAAAGGSSAASPSGTATPLPALEGAEAEYSENNMDAREFQKQGGLALFADIN